MDIIDKYLENLNTAETKNEAQTRFQHIDFLLTKVLEWPTSLIIVEDKTYNKERCDYVLVNESLKPIAIVEAKKSDRLYNIPQLKKEGMHEINKIITNNTELKKDLEQIASYCHQKSVQIGILTNGKQLIAFLGNRQDGVAPLDGKCFLIEEETKFKKKYNELLRLLSNDNIKMQVLKEELQKKDNHAQELPTLIKSRNEFKSKRKVINHSLKVLAENLLINVNEPSSNLYDIFIQECYCKSGAISDFLMHSSSYLVYNEIAEDVRIDNIPNVTDKKGRTNPDIEKGITAQINLPILLLGKVGVGKSIFIENLIRDYKKNQNTLFVKIDLGREANFGDSLKMTVIRNIINKIEEEHKIDIDSFAFLNECYKDKINTKIKRSIEYNTATNEIEKNKVIGDALKVLRDSDRANHLYKSIHHIKKNRKLTLVIIIDNIDQRPYNDQETAFLLATEIAAQNQIPVFISLRPETYFKNKIDGAASGYNHNIFKIEPPKISEALIKRLNFAIKQSNQQIYAGIGTNNSLSQLLQAISKAISQDSEIKTLFENLANENVRDAIQWISNLFSNNKIDLSKIINILETEGDYNFPFHEFIQSIMYNNNDQYIEDESDIINIFYSSAPTPNLYFIRLFILRILNDTGNISISKNTLIDMLTEFDITFTVASNEITRLRDKKLIQNQFNLRSDVITELDEESFIITSSGKYHLTTLVTKFAYLDVLYPYIPLETSIIDKIINAGTLTRNILTRVSHVEIFINHLNELSKECSFINKINWDYIYSQAQKNIDEIRTKINKFPPNSK